MGNKFLFFKQNSYDKDIIKSEKFIPLLINYKKSEIILYPSMFIPYYKNSNPFDYYDNLEDINYGSTGRIIKVLNKKTKKIYALKSIDLENEYYTINDAYKEVLIMKKLDHPNIIKLYEYYIIEKKTFNIIIEYIKDGELFEKLSKKNHFKEDETFKIMNQLFSSIKFLHDNGIIHRDIKPENIMLMDEKNLNIKLIDFCSCEIINNNKAKRKIGTPSYISPEILNGFEYDYKCDIWSLGILMYFLLSGSTPFNGNNQNEIYYKIKHENFNFDSINFNNVSNEAKNLIKSMLVKDQDKRININQVLDSDWVKKYYIKKDIQNNFIVSEDFDKNVAFKLKNFNVNNKIQLAYLCYLFHSKIDFDNEDIKKLLKIFYSIDSNNDCRLSQNDIDNFLKKYYPDENNLISNKLFSIFNDTNNINKEISFEIFGLLNMNISDYINSENIQKVFKFFDIDKIGKISINSIKKIFDPYDEINDENIWNKLFENINISNDNPLSFSIFSNYVNQLLKDELI